MKRVLLIQSDDLFSGGISRLLKEYPDITLLDKTIRDISHLIEEINEYLPNILILKNNLELFSSTCMIEVLNKYPDMRILSIDEKKNIIHVYDKQEVHVTESSDLYSLLRIADYTF